MKLIENWLPPIIGVIISYLIYKCDVITYNGSIELVKCYKDNIFVSIKIDVKRKHYYVATMFDVKKSKIDSYVKSGRLKIVNKLL